MFVITGDIDLETAEKIRSEFVKWLTHESEMDEKTSKFETTQKGKRFYDGRSTAMKSAARFWQEVQFQTTIIK